MASLSTGLPSRCNYPCMLESMYHRIARFAGLPRCIKYGLPHGRASMYLKADVSPGLPLCRASLFHTFRPPA